MVEELIRTDIAVTDDKYKCTFYDCDHRHRMKLSTILKITAELAGQDYTNKGLGHRFLWDNGYVFLLSRISIRINEFPTEPQLLDTSTWECGKKGAMFMRGYYLKCNDNILIDGESGWVVANPVTRKIIRPSAFPWKMPQVTDRPTKALPIEKIDETGIEYTGEHMVTLSDLDSNGHVYNANYADMAVNVMPREIYEKDAKNFRINYINEAKFGEKIDLYSCFSDERSVVSGKIGDKPCFEFELIY